MARGRATTVEQELRIRALHRMGFAPAQIWRELDRAGLLGDEAVSMKTIERRVKELKDSDDYEPWSLAHASEEEVRLIPEVLAHVFLETDGYGWIDKKDAKGIARVRIASPSIPLGLAYVLGEAFARAEGNRDRLELLDVLVAMKPWESESQRVQWSAAVNTLARRNGEVNQAWFTYVLQELEFPAVEGLQE